jgi:hypothetical protein
MERQAYELRKEHQELRIGVNAFSETHLKPHKRICLLYIYMYIYVYMSGAHPAVYSMGPRDSFPGGKTAGAEADHSPPSNADIKE